ncbi:MAG: OmpA family protein [Verrucomicrobiota bacterium]
MHTRLLAALLFTFTPFLQAADVKGSKDHPQLKRLDGSEILRYTTKKFDTLQIPLERIVFDYNLQKFTDWKRLNVEGARTTLFYREPKDATTLECIRAYEEDLKGKGFEILFEGWSGGSPTGDSNTLDNGYGRFIKQVFQTETDYGLQAYTMAGSDDFRFAALKKSGENGAGDIYITIFCAATTSSWKDPEKGIDTGTVLARVDVLETKAMQNRMVTVNAGEMADSISKTGRIALYGIYFDFNKTDIKPESDPTLDEIAKLIKAHAGMKLLLVGHTDNVGGWDSNKNLSERRAAAVVAALKARYGVDSKGLMPVGVAFAAPIAPNTTDEGRAKNRRVELVEY